MWLRVFEAWATARLLSSPAFHRAVHNAHKQFRRLKDGKPMEEMGGTNIDHQRPSLFKHFIDEVKDQIKGGPPRR
ncbi:hypothetical protein W97_04372 [Coniosporium apollinis CBS 100218]|uniref:Uncharacterized protein n=1 Tax=Coniosporium apollinis (strain CBS 100218) TaxID=1168221 RepID=R7YTD1_CONA1|nr:uncharacterized protein W97_04372 [Coniosporium apollinis CBS 100218]EON65135.1 hypothetical protein W97_04372 [Coniosporium apollinis CBS 100218]